MNIYAITTENNIIKIIRADGSISYNLYTKKFTYQVGKNLIVLDNVVKYKLIGNDEKAVDIYLRNLEEKKVQKIIDTLYVIKDELENHYDQDFLAYKLGEIINEIEEKVMPHDYMDNH